MNIKERWWSLLWRKQSWGIPQISFAYNLFQTTHLHVVQRSRRRLASKIHCLGYILCYSFPCSTTQHDSSLQTRCCEYDIWNTKCVPGELDFLVGAVVSQQTKQKRRRGYSKAAEEPGKERERERAWEQENNGVLHSKASLSILSV